MTTLKGAFVEHFSVIEDPRIDRKKLHNFQDILVITLCAVICGADTWENIANFGRAKYDWFKTFLELPNGIPSHDTLCRVFSLIDPLQFENCFIEWMRACVELCAGSIVPIDGNDYVHPMANIRQINQPSIWLVHFLRQMDWCWDSAKLMTNLTKLQRSPSC